MKLQPIYDRVLISKEEPPEKKTASGIIIAEPSHDQPTFGKVIATGGGLVLDNGQVRPMRVKTGMRVCFPKRIGLEIKIGMDVFIMAREDDIYAIVS